ncbi:DUF87 domain-containing protein [Candidatus Parcubacteria bacterium]|nr:MAG: DUF87 domain-containing protein [Candidatus Parcubacteria bacterium]
MGLDPDKDVIYFGRTDFRNTNRLFGIKRKDRRQHVYVVGKTGTGKSAMLNNMIVQDIANGEGVCVVDPHGELVEGVISKIPENRIDDVIYFNPADDEFHIGFNVLELPDPKYKHLVASGLMGIFTKIWSNVWSARMEYIMNNCVLALLESPGSTLLGIPRILTDKEYRQKVIAEVKDPVVKAFWIHEFEGWRDQYRNEAIAPIQNKVGQFLSTSMVRNIVGQAKSTIDIFDLMNTGKILLINVSKGRVGEDNSALLGAMLITKIQLSAMERVRVPEDERIDFYLYVDEFQNFATDSFAGILSEARKYRLNLILAHQYIGQLITDVSTKVRDAIFGNVGTMIIFRVGAADAEFLEKEFEPEFVIQDIVNLPNYSIYLRLMVDGVTSRPFSATTLPPFRVKTSGVVEERIIENSRKRYARPRAIVEAEINRWSTGLNFETSGGAQKASPGGEGSGTRYEAICSSCGKPTTVNFEPTPGRPIYCRECLAKVKSGEMAPIKSVRMPVKRERQDYQSNLAVLGIEFGSTPTEKPKEDRSRGERTFTQGPPRREMEPPRERKPILEEVEAQGTRTETPVSLSALKPEGKEKVKSEHARPQVDIDELRQAIAESLERAASEKEEGKDS